MAFFRYRAMRRVLFDAIAVSVALGDFSSRKGRMPCQGRRSADFDRVLCPRIGEVGGSKPAWGNWSHIASFGSNPGLEIYGGQFAHGWDEWGIGLEPDGKIGGLW